ncbi:HXXEE domain-containing protein [Streptococcus sp. H31]|uniref:HXXEE domain-containing protein n=1 Tax=Streptococcus huangxiaojuni TaxID=3237239 RepID=UPI0034A410A1
MKKAVNIWHYISVYLAGLTALIALFAPVESVQKCLLASITILFLHFFEEFGYPGGFPLIGMKVMMNNDEMDSTKWDVTNLSSMFGNWSFLLLLYVLPLIFPDVRFLTLSAMMFLFAEVIMHLIIFPVKLKTFYNAGQITGVLGLGFIGCYYFTTVFNPTMFIWYDYGLAIVWFVAVFLFCFRSKIYWDLGKKKGYGLTDVTAYGAGFKK